MRIKPLRFSLIFLRPVLKLPLDLEQKDPHLTRNYEVGQSLAVMIAAESALANDPANQAGFFISFLTGHLCWFAALDRLPLRDAPPAGRARAQQHDLPSAILGHAPRE